MSDQKRKKPGPARQFADPRKVRLSWQNEAFLIREAGARSTSVNDVLRLVVDHAETCPFFERRANAQSDIVQ